MFTKVFWIDAVERAIATAAQFLLVIGGADGAGFLEVSLSQVLLLSAAGAAAAILKAIVAAKKSNTDSASLAVKEM